jgi:hypothetical protein
MRDSISLGAWMGMRRLGILALFAGSALAVAACGSTTSNSTTMTEAGTTTGPADAGTTTNPTTITTDAGTVTVTTLGSTTKSIGPAGGTISLGMASLVVPAGALTQSVSISLTALSVQPDGQAAVTVYHFAPDGLTFAVPATVSLPTTSGSTQVVHWSQAASGGTFFADLPSSSAGGLATAPVTHFSGGFSGSPSSNGAIDWCPPLGSTSFVGCPAGYTCQQPGYADTCVSDSNPLVPWCEWEVTAEGYGGPPFLCYPLQPDGGGSDAEPSDGGCSVACNGSGGSPSCGDSCDPTMCTNPGTLDCSTTCNGQTFEMSCSATCPVSCTCGTCSANTCSGPPSCTEGTCSQSCTCTVNGVATGTSTITTDSWHAMWSACTYDGGAFPGTATP